MQRIPLSGKRGAGRFALVDDADFGLVSGRPWNVYDYNRTMAYAQTWTGNPPHRTSLQMHVLIMGAIGIDHIDGDGLNNQRYNLRLADQGLNNQNRRPQRTCRGIVCSSRYKGVSLHKATGRWRAMITLNRRTRSLGLFASEIDAALAYDAAARELFGEYARPNFP